MLTTSAYKIPSGELSFYNPYKLSFYTPRPPVSLLLSLFIPVIIRVCQIFKLDEWNSYRDNHFGVNDNK